MPSTIQPNFLEYVQQQQQQQQLFLQPRIQSDFLEIRTTSTKREFVEREFAEREDEPLEEEQEVGGEKSQDHYERDEKDASSAGGERGMRENDGCTGLRFLKSP